MKISYLWLKEFADVNVPLDELCETLTQTGLEVEGITKVEEVPGGLAGLVVGQVVECKKHPNADKLKVTRVDIGKSELLDIVCGAPNVAKAQKVIVAPVNTTIHPIVGKPFKIKKMKIRGEQSKGMICAKDEIGLGTDHDGIVILDGHWEVGLPVAGIYKPETDMQIDIGLTPNRGDAASHLGVARDISAFYKTGISVGHAQTFLKTCDDKAIEVSVENHQACPRYCGITIRNIKVGPSPDWLKFRLKVIGIASINNIVDITNYVLHGLGQPLHAFDADEIIGGKVVVKTLKEGDSFYTLDEKERKLGDQDLMICNESEGMCIAGVFGGIKSGVKDHTTNIFLESAYFDPNWIRATAKRHGLNTDASFRYERGTDPEIPMQALKYATKLILENAGGRICSDFVDVYPDPIKPRQIKTSFDTFNRLIGKQLKKEEIGSILRRLQIDLDEIGDDKIIARVPAFRSDVTRPADLVEEVLRIYGFNNIGLRKTLSTDYIADFKEVEPYKVQEELSIFLSGAGFHEIVTNSLTNPDYLEKFPGTKTPVEILNSSSKDLAIMKIHPLMTGLEVVRHNINRAVKDLRLFEFTKSYSREEDYKENQFLTIYLTGKTMESWQSPNRPFVLHDLTNIITTIIQQFNITKTINHELYKDKIFDFGISITATGQTLLSYGKINDSLCEYFGIQQTVYYAQLDWELLLRLIKMDKQFKPIPKYPRVRRDLSIIVDKSIRFARIEILAYKIEKKLIDQINVFSIFENDSIGKDKRSYAIAFFLQDTAKTLKDKQIDKIMSNLIAVFEKELGAIIRK